MDQGMLSYMKFFELNLSDSAMDYAEFQAFLLKERMK
jgi:hypothetical protein